MSVKKGSELILKAETWSLVDNKYTSLVASLIGVIVTPEEEHNELVRHKIGGDVCRECKKHQDKLLVEQKEKVEEIKALIENFPDTNQNLALVSILMEIQKWKEKLEKVMEDGR